MNFTFLFVEIAAIILFCFGFQACWKQSKERAFEFFMIFVYGLILEELDMRFFKTYHYGPDFFFMMGQVPICIALLWAVIVAGAMAISDALGLPEAMRPFLDAILAVWMDLAIDAIAIRIGFWSWVIPLNEGWFGVPGGNLYAWMWVAFLYSALARIVRQLIQRNPKWVWAYLAVPILAYLGLYFQLVTVGVFGRLTGLTSQLSRVLIFFFHFFVFAVIVAASWRLRKPTNQKAALIWRLSRYFIHTYSLVTGFLFGFFQQIPALAFVAFFVLILEVILAIRLKQA